MSKTAAQIDALIAHADELYNSADASRADLLQAERLYLDALDYKLEHFGPDAQIMGQLHNALGMIYGKLHDHFDQGEAHYSAAAKIFTDAPNQAIVLNNHAILLVKKGTKLLAESEALSNNIDDNSGQVSNSRGATLASTPETRGLSSLLSRSTVKTRSRELEAATAESEALSEQVRALRQLSTTNGDALNCFKRADSLRLRALTIMQKHARKQTEAMDKAKSIAAGAKAKPSTSTAVVVHNGGKNGIVLRSPAEIMAALDKTAIGQKAAKRGIANAASQHLRRMMMTPEKRAKTDKSNVLLLGPTGCGKTLLVSDLARILGVPFYRSDASKLTAAGYVGEDVQSLLEGLLRNCDYNLELAQNGIIYVDEIDKIRSHNMGGSKDVGGESVQQELLTILEGAKLQVTGQSGKRDDNIEIDTTNILFICGGAFVGLGDFVARRIQDKGTSIGFGATLHDKKKDNTVFQRNAVAEDFIAFGLIPEFIGRLPKRLFLEKLTLEQLERILVEPEKALTVQKRLLTEGVTDLRFTRGALKAMAEEAYKAGTNGRGLSEIMEAVLEPIIFEQPKMAIVTAEMVMKRNEEIEGQSDDNDPRPALPDFIIDDEDVDSVMAAAVARPKVDRNLPVVQRGRRDLTVVKAK